MGIEFKSFLDSQEEDLDFRAEMILAELAMNIAETIRDTRIQLNMTQVELANKIQIKQSQVSRYENTATARFTLNSLAKLADALDCTLTVSLTPKTQAGIQSFAESAANNVIKFPSRTLTTVVA